MPDKIIYHSSCFVCRVCKNEFEEYYWPFQLIPYCLTHYLVASGMTCCSCEMSILENAVIVHGRKWHSACFVCSKNGCHVEFQESYNLHGGKPYCDEHYKEISGVTCSSCGLAIDEQAVKALGGLFHKKCFSCVRCATPILQDGQPPLQFFAMAGKAICLSCHEVNVLWKCVSCSKTKKKKKKMIYFSKRRLWIPLPTFAKVAARPFLEKLVFQRLVQSGAVAVLFATSVRSRCLEDSSM